VHPARCDINYARLISLCHVLTQHAHPYDCIPCISPYPTSALSRVCRDLYHFLSWNMESCVSVAYCPHPDPPMPPPVYRTPLTRCARTLGCMHRPSPDPLPLSCPHSFVNRLPSCNRVRVRRHLHLLRSPAPTTAHSRGCLHRGALWYPCPNALRSTSRRSTWSGRQLAATQEEAF